jgi:hypothetical protein
MSIYTRKPACCISAGVSKKAVRDWTNGDHKEIMGIHNRINVKSFFKNLSAKRAVKLLELYRNQICWGTKLFIGQCHLKGQLLKF